MAAAHFVLRDITNTEAGATEKDPSFKYHQVLQD